MRILVICQYYYPEPFRITDICEELVKRGHNITVITGIPNYPMGKIYDGYRFGQKRDEVINGVNVHRCFAIGRRQGTFFRFLNYYSYAISSEKYVSQLTGEYDVVFIYQLSPVLMASAGIKYKKKYGKKLILYCLDLWPESLCAGGLKKDSIIYKYYHRISGYFYKQADKLLISSKSFGKYFESEFGIYDTEYVPQYAEELFTPEICRKEPNGVIDLMFAGNIGAVQSVKTLIQAAKLTQSVPQLHWHVVGDGIELANLQKQAETLSNITFHGRKSLQEMPRYYSMADAMLVTLGKNEKLSLTMPGKVQSYMAAGKPIIACCDGETNLILNEAQCGFICDSEDVSGLLKCVEGFINDKRKENMAQRSRLYYTKHFSKQIFMTNLEYYLND